MPRIFAALALFLALIALASSAEAASQKIRNTCAIELNPNASEAYVNRGAAYRGKRDFDHALADLNRALELNPKHETALYNRGGMYNDKGDYEHAIADLT